MAACRACQERAANEQESVRERARICWRALRDVQPQILRDASLKVVIYGAGFKRLPDSLRPRSQLGPVMAHMAKTWSFERPRLGNPQGVRCMPPKTPIDLFKLQPCLTVKFSNCVDEDWHYFHPFTSRREGDGLPLDKKAVAEAINVEKQWFGVSKIRLQRDAVISQQLQWHFELIFVNGTHEFAGDDFSMSNSRKNTLTDMLTQQLQLEHTVPTRSVSAAGLQVIVEEFSVPQE